MNTTPPILETPPTTPPSKADRRKGAQERFMFMMIGAFFGGVALYLVLPDGPVRGIAIGFFSCAVYWAIFKYAL